MADPAKLLYDQLTEWSTSEVLADVRKLKTKEGWHRQRIAAVNLDHVMVLLDRLDAEGEDTSPWRDYSTVLHKAVFGFGTDWERVVGRQASADNPINVHALRSLRSLSAICRHLIPQLKDDGVQQLEDMLSSETLQQPSEEFPYELRAYFIRVRDHLVWCVKHFDEVGEFSLHEAAMQFQMTAQFMTVVAPESEKDSWWDFMKNQFVWPFVSTMTTAPAADWAGSQLGSMAQRIMELGSGS